ncbi:MAG: diversity-generating retroelement protein Avd [Elusimicrobia bacterium]|nr:diversity-generating retroelement protein Avd [Elusimicrobiota bacterium]
MNADRLKVFTKAYDFTLWMMNHTAKYPKSARFSVASRIENRLLDFMGAVLRGNRGQEKLPALAQADMALEELRILLRLSKDMRFVNLGSYEYGARELDGIGKMLGAWMKQQRPKGAGG